MNEKVLIYFTNKDDGNLSYFMNDLKKNIDKNRKNLASKLDYDSDKLIDMYQIHSNEVKIVDESSPKHIKDVDGIITKQKNLPLMVMVADCIPILFYDEKKEIIAAIHAGRNSTFLKICDKTIEKMQEIFSSDTEDIKVVFGPSIQKCCYEVSEELIAIVKKSFGKKFIYGKNIDLQGINKMLLEKKGVKNIEISSICTKCTEKPYFSHRKGDKGRSAGIIMLKKTLKY